MLRDLPNRTMYEVSLTEKEHCMPSPFGYARDEDEHSHQVALFMWSACATHNGFEAAWSETSYAMPGWCKQKIPVAELKWLFAIPNGGQRDARVGANLKAEGVKPGVSDLMFPVARFGYHGLFIEMKKPGGKPSLEQKDFLAFTKEQGYAVVVADHWQKAAEILERYLGSNEDGIKLFSLLG